MKSLRLFSGLLLIAAIAPLASAEVPKKAAPGRYSKLSGATSPFTTPKIVKPEDPVGAFVDYALSAVSPVTGGYFVILQNKKKPDERITLQPGSVNDLGFTVDEVRPGSTGLLSTTVMLSNGKSKGLVAFDEKLLVLKPTAPPNKGGHNGGGPQPGQPGFNPNQQPGNNNPVVMNGGAPNPNPNPTVNPAPNPNPTGRGPGSGNNNFNPGGGRNNNGGGNTQGGGGGGNRPPRPRVVSPNR